MIQRVILAEHEKIVGGGEPMSNAPPPSERLRALEQLKKDGLDKRRRVQHQAKRRFWENFSCPQPALKDSPIES